MSFVLNKNINLKYIFGTQVPHPFKRQQADNLAKLRQEFLSVTKPIAKIFGAVSRTKA